MNKIVVTEKYVCITKWFHADCTKSLVSSKALYNKSKLKNTVPLLFHSIHLLRGHICIPILD